MDAPVVYRQIRSEPRHLPTGRARHYRGCADGHREEFPAPDVLQIARYGGNHGSYLFYLDASGKEKTDHESLGDAMSQAEQVFGVGVGEWTVLPAEETR